MCLQNTFCCAHKARILNLTHKSHQPEVSVEVEHDPVQSSLLIPQQFESDVGNEETTERRRDSELDTGGSRFIRIYMENPKWHSCLCNANLPG